MSSTRRFLSPVALPLTLRLAVPAVLAAAALPRALAAQGPAPVPIGATVRVLAPPTPEWRQGRFAGDDGELLLIGVTPPGERRELLEAVP